MEVFMKDQFLNESADLSEKKEKIELQLKELSRNYSIRLELIEKTNNQQELVEVILNEYISRLNEIPGVDLKDLSQQKDINYKKEKLKSLIMFATQAVVLKEKAELYKKLEDKNQELTFKNDELKTKNEHYLNMLSFVSHELRNPLISILGYAQLLDDKILGELNNEQHEAINVIIRSSKNLIDMIKNYLDLVKIETGQMKIKIKEGIVNILEHVIKTAIFEMNDQFVQKQMKVIPLQILDSKLRVDKELMKIVFINLFSNAIKYGRQGTEIGYSMNEEKEDYLFSIKNMGIGVKEEKLTAIFNKFTQIHEVKQPDLQRGTGLGLFIAKTIVEEHGGKIWAESKYNEWFQVYFTIPKKLAKATTFQQRNREIPLMMNAKNELSLRAE